MFSAGNDFPIDASSMRNHSSHLLFLIQSIGNFSAGERVCEERTGVLVTLRGT